MTDIGALLQNALPVPGMDGRVFVPEHVVKGVLREAGIRTPAGAVATDARGLEAAAAGLVAPLVLKAWGPGLVHKSDAGAVRVGLAHEELHEGAAAITAAMADHGLQPAGFLVEEQAPPGVELIVGVVRRPGFGLLALVGLGGTLTEVVGDACMRLYPLRPDDAAAMLDGFRGAAALRGARGTPPADRDALVALLLAVAGEGGLVDALSPQLTELECNPVRVTADGAIALDARLVLDPAATAPVQPSATDFGPFFRPRAIAIAGASTSGKMSFGNRALEAYRELGWSDGLYAVHPSASDVTGVPAFPSVADIEGGVDYLLVAVPAASCGPLLTASAGAVPFAHVISGGFGETGPDGAALEGVLLNAAKDAGIRFVGPNCIGVYCPKGRHSFQLDTPMEPGHVAVVAQSGGLSGDIIKAGYLRGLRYSKVIAIGNAVDVTAGELVEYLLSDDDTEVIGLYLEGTRDGERLIDALRSAAGRKPVVALVGGLSEQGAQAAASHTGALAGDGRTWDAISASTGTTVVRTLEDLLGGLTFLQRYHANPGRPDQRVLVIGVGGGSTVLAADACSRAGLDVPTLPDAVQEKLRAAGVGLAMSVANPIEIQAGPLAPADAWHQVLEPVLAEVEFPDLLWHINVQAYYSYGGDGIGVLSKSIDMFGENRWPSTRVSVVLRNLECAPPDDVRVIMERLAGNGLPFFRTLDEGVLAIAAGKRFDGTRKGPMTMGELDGKVAVVSGIGPGLGRDVALLFAREGAAVVLAARTTDVLSRVAGEIDDIGGKAICVTTDITDAGECTRLLETAVAEGGGLDVLVNNAFAFGPRELMKDMSIDEWRPTFEVNVLGTMRLSIAAAEIMAARGGGSIVMVNSQAMRRSEARRGAYASSKAALLAAARTLASEAGRTNVRVNSVVPGQIWGPPLEEHYKGVAERRGVSPQDVYDEAARAMALRRIATGAEVAEAVLFFASARSSGITGQSLDVNAGNWFE